MPSKTILFGEFKLDTTSIKVGWDNVKSIFDILLAPRSIINNSFPLIAKLLGFAKLVMTFVVEGFDTLKSIFKTLSIPSTKNNSNEW